MPGRSSTYDSSLDGIDVLRDLTWMDLVDADGFPGMRYHETDVVLNIAYLFK
jgi:hypothetical protein